MRGRAGWVSALLIILTFAQAGVNVLLWFARGLPVAGFAGYAIGSVVLVAGIAFLADFLAARATYRGAAGSDGFVYLLVLLLAFFLSVLEACFIVFWSAGGPGGAFEFRWTRGTVILTVVVALVVFAAFVIATRYVWNAYATSLILDIVCRLFFPQGLSRGFGVLGGNFGPRDVAFAIPLAYPDGELTDLERSGLAENLDRGTAWVDALLARHRGTVRPDRAPVPAVTAAGFVRLQDKTVNLAVINYFPPRFLIRALRTMRREEISLGGETFPVVARPWLPMPHSGDEASGDGAGDGHCWVTFFSRGSQRNGLLTARHALNKPDAKRGSPVSTVTSRPAKTGILHAVSEDGDIDVALIDLSDDPDLRLTDAPCSTEPAGLRQIRFYTGGRTVDCLVTAWTEWRKDLLDETPGKPARVFFTKFGSEDEADYALGRPGDSGALILDLKSTDNDGRSAPYLMYLEAASLAPGQESEGVLLAHISRLWQLTTKRQDSAEYNDIDPLMAVDTGRGGAGKRGRKRRRVLGLER